MGVWWRSLYLIAVCLPVQSCEHTEPLVEGLTPPSISADPIVINRAPGTSTTITASYTPPGGLQTVTRIELVINRHRGIGAFDPLVGERFTIGTAPSTAGTVTVNLPNGFFPPNSLVSAQWFVDYRLNSGTEIASVSSAIVSARADCTPQQVTTFLAGLQATVLAGAPATLVGPLPAPVFTPAMGPGIPYVPTHGYRNFIGQGTAFASPNLAEATGVLPLSASAPGLLLYTAAPGTTAAQASEPNNPDPPYTLVGFAFATRFDPDGPPVFRCMPHEAWFVHEAGFHNMDGSFTPETISETAPGTENPLLPGSLPPITTPGIGAVPPWHPRLWDVHLWINTTTGVPDVNVCNVTAFPPRFTRNLATCTGAGFTRIPAIGSPFPAAGFFQLPLDP